MSKTLYALLVGIDQYQYIPNLGGCKADIQKVSNYLQESAQSSGFTYLPHTVFDDQATRAGLIQAFETHLIAQAKKGDIAMIYYSGHGAQEEAGELFKDSEHDGKLEGWVCHDTGKDQETTEPLLVDKELRYLLHRLAQAEPDIIFISDSCHSNDNTRSAQFSGADEPEKLVRRTGITLPARPYEKFLFAKDIPQAAFAGKPLSEVIPQGRAVSVAACESWEFAYETNGGGIFTHFLLETLKQSRGPLSYYDLQSRVRMQIRNRLPGLSQIPRVAAVPGHQDDLFREFLNGAVKNRPLYGNLSNQRFDQDQGISLWDYDKGQIHGVKRADPDKGEGRVSIPLADGKTAYGYIKQVNTADSVVEVLATEVSFELLDPTQTYEGFLPGLMTAPLVLHFTGEADGVAALNEYVTKFADTFKDSQIYFTDTPNEAHYYVQAIRHGAHQKPYLILTNPGDHRPLTEQVQGWDEPFITELFEQIKTVMPWHFLYHLRNDHTDALPEDAISLTLTQEGQAAALQGQVGELHYTEERGGMPAGKVSIKLTNNTQEKLFVACLFMDSDFSIAPEVLQPTIVHLDPGGSVLARGGKDLRLAYSMQLDWFNWPADQYYLKVIASTETIQVDEFAQGGVKPPIFPWPERGLGKRGLSWDDEEEEEPAKTWQAMRFTLRVPNPRYRPDEPVAAPA
jgi:hypothetical protein